MDLKNRTGLILSRNNRSAKHLGDMFGQIAGLNFHNRYASAALPNHGFGGSCDASKREILTPGVPR